MQKFSHMSSARIALFESSKIFTKYFLIKLFPSYRLQIFWKWWFWQKYMWNLYCVKDMLKFECRCRYQYRCWCWDFQIARFHRRYYIKGRNLREKSCFEQKSANDEWYLSKVCRTHLYELKNISIFWKCHLRNSVFIKGR